MIIYPAIDLREGATVQLVGGDPTREAVHEPDPLQVAHRWTDQGASALHVVDLDAAIGTGSNLHIVNRILNAIPLPVQLGGGVRHLVDIQRRLDMGVGRVIIGTQGIKHPDWLLTAAELYPGKIILAVDARGDDIAISGWQEGSGVTLPVMLRQIEDIPLAGLLYTNVDIEGSMGGVDRAAVEKVVGATRHGVIASGGIAELSDLDVLKDVGVAGAVLGMSLYTGRIQLVEAIKRIEGREVQTGRHVMIPKPKVQWGNIPDGAPAGRVIGAADAGPSSFVKGTQSGSTDSRKLDSETPGAEAGDAPKRTEDTGEARTRPRTAWGKRKRPNEDSAETDA